MLYSNLHAVFHKRVNFTSLVTGMVMLLLAIGAIVLPATYFFIHKQYQNGQVDSESQVNASFIAEKLEENPEWLITHPALERFVKEDVLFNNADAFEARAIVAENGKTIVFQNREVQLAWPVIFKQTTIAVEGKTKGFYLITRSLAHILVDAFAIFVSSLLSAILIAFLLNRFVLRRLGLAENDLLRNAKFDALTGLPNRVETMKELHRRLALDVPGVTAVLFVDLDKFKMVNDTYGHAVGDVVLKDSASRLRNCIRPEDFFGRLSGDEFIIILSLKDGEIAINRIAESVINAFSLTHICLGHEVAITATVGIALAPEHGTRAEELIQRADTAMYSLKEYRRGGWKLYEPAMTEKIDREMHLRTKLKRALQREEFELHYQPIVHLVQNRIIGAEALIRWRDADTGELVLPTDFISELEHSGLIVPVGEWVLRTACKQVAAWRKTLPRFHIAINVSARQFVEEGFVESFARILMEEKVAPDAIALELTESMLIDDVLTTSKLVQLKTLGIWLGLDDFGTGFSSLGRLASMPFDVIKIDRQFVSQMHLEERQRSVVVAIIALAHGLGMRVVAEGIELAEQRDAVQALGCQQGQGFLFSKPLPAEAFHALYIAGTPMIASLPAVAMTTPAA